MTTDTMFFLPSEMWKGSNVITESIEDYVKGILYAPHSIAIYPYIKIRIHQMHLKYE